MTTTSHGTLAKSIKLKKAAKSTESVRIRTVTQAQGRARQDIQERKQSINRTATRKASHHRVILTFNSNDVTETREDPNSSIASKDRNITGPNKHPEQQSESIQDTAVSDRGRSALFPRLYLALHAETISMLGAHTADSYSFILVAFSKATRTSDLFYL